MVKPHVQKQLDELQRIRDTHGYLDRVKAQCLSWAMGKPYHCDKNQECCPDFSCCFPDLFTTDDAKRWALYKEKFGH